MESSRVYENSFMFKITKNTLTLQICKVVPLRVNGDVVAKEELLNHAKAQLAEAQKANVELRQKVAKEKEALRKIKG